MESFKTKSRIITILTTIVIAIITYIASMNPDQLANQLGIYGSWAGVIIVVCASIINQISEEKRVQRAENLVYKECANDPPIRVEVDATEALAEIEKRKQEAMNNTDQPLTEPPIINQEETTIISEENDNLNQTEPELVDPDDDRQ